MLPANPPLSNPGEKAAAQGTPQCVSFSKCSGTELPKGDPFAS